MNLRTITFWAIYSPARKEIIVMRQFRHQLKAWPRRDCVLVKLKGHYVRPRTVARNRGTTA